MCATRCVQTQAAGARGPTSVSPAVTTAETAPVWHNATSTLGQYIALVYVGYDHVSMGFFCIDLFCLTGYRAKSCRIPGLPGSLRRLRVNV